MKQNALSVITRIKLEEFDYAGATAIATMMLAASFAILFLVNALQRRVARGQI